MRPLVSLVPAVGIIRVRNGPTIGQGSANVEALRGLRKSQQKTTKQKPSVHICSSLAFVHPPQKPKEKNKTYTLSAQSRETRLTIRIRKEITRRVMTALIGNCPHSHERQEKEKKNSSQKFVAFFVPQTFISAVGVIRVRDGATIRQGAANIQAIRVLHQPANAVSRRATSHVACGHTQVARSGS